MGENTDASIPIERERNPLAKEFAQAIVKKYVLCYDLAKGTKANGKEITNRSNGYHFRAFESSLSDQEDSWAGDSNCLRSAVEIQWNLFQNKNRDLERLNKACSHIVSIGRVREINPEKKWWKPNLNREKKNFQDKYMAVSTLFMQDAAESGGNCVARTFTVLPREVAGRFLEEIQKDPDLVEDFYQETFRGFDAKENHPGIHRVKADGFYLITEFNLEDAFGGLVLSSSKLKKYTYKNGPYGENYVSNIVKD